MLQLSASWPFDGVSFSPDSTRSGYFPDQADAAGDDEEEEDPLLLVPVSESELSEDEGDNGFEVVKQ